MPLNDVALEAVVLLRVVPLAPDGLLVELGLLLLLLRNVLLNVAALDPVVLLSVALLVPNVLLVDVLTLSKN